MMLFTPSRLKSATWTLRALEKYVRVKSRNMRADHKLLHAAGRFDCRVPFPATNPLIKRHILMIVKTKEAVIH